MVNTYVNYTDLNGFPEQKGDARNPVYVTDRGKATACNLLKEPTASAEGSAGVISVKGAPILETYEDGSSVVSRPSFLSSLVESSTWINPINLEEINTFIDSLFS